MNILDHLLRAPVMRGPHTDLVGWSSFSASCPFEGHMERALWSGFHADRLGYAFVGGYDAALERLVGGRDVTNGHIGKRRSLCATEAGGVHPRAIATRLVEQGSSLILAGEKTFATLATVAEELLVVATQGSDDAGRPRLCLVRVKADAPGVTIVARAPVPFAPEVPHAIVRLVDVEVTRDEVLPGDGYDDYLKPFRTIEDTHVLAATIAYLLGVARAWSFDRTVVTELLASAAALVELGAREPGSPLTHLLLAGHFSALRRLVAASVGEWTKVTDDERARWERDQPLLLVAEGARQKRTEAAFRTLEAHAST